MTEADQIEALLKIIRRFADPDYQRRIWIEGVGPEVSSYTEEFEKFFGDYFADEFLAHDLKSIAPSQIAALREFSRVLANFDTTVPRMLDDEEIVKKPGWESVVTAARNAASTFPS